MTAAPGSPLVTCRAAAASPTATKRIGSIHRRSMAITLAHRPVVPAVAALEVAVEVGDRAEQSRARAGLDQASNRSTSPSR
ncbi:hypothetical protein Misp03_15800 [Microbispora sp. NBRC 16548]|nr:hypothetical protein Misp03_15800 [Microbispora sp. NBRC 16548]